MRSTSRFGLVVGVAVFAVLCLAAAGILKWVVVPNQAKVPSDENTTRRYDGTAKVLLNPQALVAGDLNRVLIVNTPVNVTRTVRALATNGDAAQLQETRTLTTADGQAIGRTTATYAVDRKTLEATSDHPSNWQVAPAKGLTVSWPIGAEKKDYTGWVQETQSTTTLRYLREETKRGLSTYVYQASTAPAPIKDPQVLGALPTSLPVSTLEALSAALPLDPQVKAQLAALIPRLTQPVPLTYTYQVQSTYWVEPTTGLVVDTQREDVRKAGISVQGTMVAAITVFDVATAYTSTTVADAAGDANDDKDAIDLFGTTLPLILLIVGVVALIAAAVIFILSRRSRPSQAPPASGDVAGPGPAAT